MSAPAAWSCAPDDEHLECLHSAYIGMPLKSERMSRVMSWKPLWSRPDVSCDAVISDFATLFVNVVTIGTLGTGRGESGGTPQSDRENSHVPCYDHPLELSDERC